jgi:surface protein
MDNMFRDCQSLTSIGNVSNWDISNVETMGGMFANCYKLTSLDLSNWDTSNVTNMSSMFSGCTSLQELRLDGCSKDTISKIINSNYFPANNTGTIYCKRTNAEGLVAPENWTFSYID